MKTCCTDPLQGGAEMGKALEEEAFLILMS
jgi:hypothetical protein